MDQAVVGRFGIPEQNPRFAPKPGMWDAQYIDQLGWVYFDINGSVIGLRSDAGHIARSP